MIEKWDITIPELTGDEVRSAYICLPEAYRSEEHTSELQSH